MFYHVRLCSFVLPGHFIQVASPVCLALPAFIPDFLWSVPYTVVHGITRTRSLSAGFCLLRVVLSVQKRGLSRKVASRTHILSLSDNISVIWFARRRASECALCCVLQAHTISVGEQSVEASVCTPCLLLLTSAILRTGRHQFEVFPSSRKSIVLSICMPTHFCIACKYRDPLSRFSVVFIA